MRLLPWTVIAAALALGSCTLFGGGHRPNLLVISVDSLRFDAISSSIGAAKTPHLHALAAEGQSFTHCYSHSPAAWPAHVALFSARVPSETGVTTNGVAIDRNVTLFAEWMRTRGYSTSASVSLASLWTPEETLVAGGRPAKAKLESPTGLERGFGSYSVGPHELSSSADVNESLLGNLDALPKDQAWFLFAQYSEPHEPFDAMGSAKNTAEATLDGKALETIETSETNDWDVVLTLSPGLHELAFRATVPTELRRIEFTAKDDEIEHRFVTGALHEPSKKLVLALENKGTTDVECTVHAWLHDVPDVAEARVRYKLEVEAVDRAIGELIDQLKARGEYDNTLIVVTADHGIALGEHDSLGRESNLYDEQLRIPFIVKPQRGCDDFPTLAKLKHSAVRQIDIVPTVLDLLGLRVLPGAEGVTMLKEADRTLLAEVHPPESPHSIFCRRDGRYKLIYDAGSNRFQMFDVQRDTLEADDIYDLQGHFRGDWQTELHQLAQSSPQAANVRMGMAGKRPEYLKALGY